MEVLPTGDFKVALSVIENTYNITKSYFNLIPYGRQFEEYISLTPNYQQI